MGFGKAIVRVMKVVMGALHEVELVLKGFMGCAKLAEITEQVLSSFFDEVDLQLQLTDDFFNKSSSFGLPFSECGLQVGLTLLHGGLQVGL